ncbi:MAG: PTS transporter subunit EIIC, partial [Erysipelotrichaceae bacterium]|nr:PTS transporter subunit EIIC [Erysipelotrichaceae bacterium]
AKLKHRNYMVVAGLTAVCTYILTMHGTTSDKGIWSVEFSRFGPTGILVGMVVGIYVSIVFNLIAKIRFFKKGSDVPTFVQDWVKNIIPIFVTVLIQSILVFNLNLDFYKIILGIFMPLQYIAQSYPGFIVTTFIQAFFYSLGVSGWTWTGLTNAYQVPAQTANLEQGLTGATAFLNVSEITSGVGLINLGGMCATLALNVLFLFSKSKRLKTLGRVCIGPGLFNINEPIIYGAPVIYNPILLIPAWICALVGPAIVYWIFRLQLLNLPNVQLPMVGTLPILVCTVMLTGDLRGLLWWAVMFALYLAIWYPFFRRYEKQVLDEEAKAEAANVSAEAKAANAA